MAITERRGVASGVLRQRGARMESALPGDKQINGPALDPPFVVNWRPATNHFLRSISANCAVRKAFSPMGIACIPVGVFSSRFPVGFEVRLSRTGLGDGSPCPSPPGWIPVRRAAAWAAGNFRL